MSSPDAPTTPAAAPPPPPAISYPPALPISARVDEIAHAIATHQVVVVAGETGSGKTTQLPKICLQLGRGSHGTIGHTQPRRLAARTVADRIATELNTPLGETVGYQVRFHDHASSHTRVKIMTDGILLAELARDRQLRRYDTLIIDEAHERSLNIDFLLGYLKQLLPRRPDLKLIITSATIDPHRFATHFTTEADNPPPVIEVSGRTYPVDIRYRPIEDPDTDQPQAICDAVTELATEAPGDILVFLSGEREIRDTAEALRRHTQHQPRLAGTDILPLYARLSLAEQHRAFQSHPGRRIVLATNVAETSLTVPGIRYVIDPGTARVSRYSNRLKVQRLPIEPVSQASATQRAGRCGRLADGICVRLYSEQDFQNRPAFTDPEILRTNLASVILHMAALRLGDIASFPFLDPPDNRQITDGIRLLEELGALRPARRETPKLTNLGRRLATLPIDPRLARMVLEADNTGCLPEMLVIASALSIQDPRERPTDAREHADQLHARFRDPSSDFGSYLHLWRYLHEQQDQLSSSKFRRLCRTEHLNYLRVREWQDLHEQLRRATKAPRGPLPESATDPRTIHTSLLSGLLSHIGVKDLTANDPRRRHDYLGARGARFAIAPGSALFKKSPQWVMVAELVETSRLWGRIAAGIQPEWVEPLAEHLTKRTYSEPHWSAKRGAVLAYEKVTLYGLPIVARRQINFGRVDPKLARELFIRHALVEGDWNTHHQFFHDNQALLQHVTELEERARRRDILIDDETLFDFYHQRIGEDVVSAAHFDRWWKQTRRTQPDLLTLTLHQLINPDAGTITETAYPQAWTHGSLQFPLTYQFTPGQAGDGVTAHLPVTNLHHAAAARLDWQVPGLRRELVIAWLRSLPKPLRRQFVPATDVATDALAILTPYQQPLTEALAAALRELTGTTVPPEAWDWSKVPDHLKITYRVHDETGTTLAEGKDLQALRAQLAGAARASLSAAATEVEHTGLRDWSIGTLPSHVQLAHGGHQISAYPALIDKGDHVDVQALPTPQEQAAHHRAGLRRLVLLGLPSTASYVSGRLSDQAKLALTQNPHGSIRALLADCTDCAADALIAETGHDVWDAERFTALRTRLGAELNRATLGVVTELLPVIQRANQLTQRLSEIRSPALAHTVADVRQQLAELIQPGFVTGIGWGRLPDLRRWLEAALRRLDKAGAAPERDRQAMATIHQVRDAYEQARSQLPASARPQLDQIRWMIEELRVSLFAQQLGTAYPISEQRIAKALAGLR